MTSLHTNSVFLSLPQFVHPAARRAASVVEQVHTGDVSDMGKELLATHSLQIAKFRLIKGLMHGTQVKSGTPTFSNAFTMTRVDLK